MARIENFDANTVDPIGEFEPIPADRYEAMIVESETVANASGNGSHLKLKLVVTKGPHEGAPLWHRLNLDNPSEKAVQIARGQLSTICRAIGVLTPKDSTELHNLPLMVNVKLEKFDNGTPEGGVSNRITSFAPRETATTTAKATTQPPTTATPATVPWKR